MKYSVFEFGVNKAYALSLKTTIFLTSLLPFSLVSLNIILPLNSGIEGIVFPPPAIVLTPCLLRLITIIISICYGCVSTGGSSEGIVSSGTGSGSGAGGGGITVTVPSSLIVKSPTTDSPCAIASGFTPPISAPSLA